MRWVSVSHFSQTYVVLRRLFGPASVTPGSIGIWQPGHVMTENVCRCSILSLVLAEMVKPKLQMPALNCFGRQKIKLLMGVHKFQCVRDSDWNCRGSGRRFI